MCLPRYFPAGVEPPPQSAQQCAERSKHKAAWHEAMEIEKDPSPKTTGPYKAATPPQGRKPLGVKWMFTYKTDKDVLVVKTGARLVVEGLSQVQGANVSHQLPRQRQLKLWRLLPMSLE